MFSLINICNFGNRLNLIKKIPRGHDRVRGNFEQIEEFGCLFNYTICVLCILLFGLLPKLQNMIFEHFFFLGFTIFIILHSHKETCLTHINAIFYHIIENYFQSSFMVKIGA